MEPLLFDSITDATPAVAGRIAVSGSHGGLYPAVLASRAGLRAVAFNDAGIGYEGAGTAGVMHLATVGMAAVACAALSCRIGDTGDMLARGRVSTVNPVARALGVAPGMTLTRALELLAGAPEPAAHLPAMPETRREVTLEAGQTVILADSASLIGAGDAGRLIVTGSHGGLIGGDPARACKAEARAVAFNDAGLGPGECATARLPALDQRGIAAVTVDANTARIGDAASALMTGIISRANRRAEDRGARAGLPLAQWLAHLPLDPTPDPP